MSQLNLRNLDHEIHQLPSLSVVVTQLLELLGHDDLTMTQLMTLVGKDQALAARILRIANSPFYGLSRRVGSLQDAGTLLGIHTLGNIVTAAGVMGHFPPGGGDGFDRLSFWQHAIGVGTCARVLARHGGLDAEMGFTAGLLHDMGKLVLASYFTSDFAAVLTWRDEHDCLLRDAEQAVLGLDHTELGARVARHWRLPLPVVNAIAYHHSLPEVATPLSELVHVADILARGLDIGHGGDDLIPTLKASALPRLGLDWQTISACLGEIESLNAAAGALLTGAANPNESNGERCH
ncbi:MAG: HDOD domain-containing protein [Gammaproteobacteria bacterium]|nr:HDOD domain-containing protein [Gammaproteobacteria bacterium]